MKQGNFEEQNDITQITEGLDFLSLDGGLGGNLLGEELDYLDYHEPQGPNYEPLNNLLRKCVLLNVHRDNNSPNEIIQIFRTSFFHDFNNFIKTQNCSKEQLIAKLRERAGYDIANVLAIAVLEKNELGNDNLSISDSKSDYLAETINQLTSTYNEMVNKQNDGKAASNEIKLFLVAFKNASNKTNLSAEILSSYLAGSNAIETQAIMRLADSSAQEYLEKEVSVLCNLTPEERDNESIKTKCIKIAEVVLAKIEDKDVGSVLKNAEEGLSVTHPGYTAQTILRTISRCCSEIAKNDRSDSKRKDIKDILDGSQQSNSDNKKRVRD